MVSIKRIEKDSLISGKHYLVSSLHRRSICVSIHGTVVRSNYSYVLCEVLEEAAEIAWANGWKRVVVALSPSDEIGVFNMHQWHTSWDTGFSGIRLVASIYENTPDPMKGLYSTEEYLEDIGYYN